MPQLKLLQTPAPAQDIARRWAAARVMQKNHPAAAPQARVQAPATLLARAQADRAALVKVVAPQARDRVATQVVAPEQARAQAADKEPARFRGSRFRAAKMLPTIHLRLTPLSRKLPTA